jgi:hypothetical protein
MLLLFPGMGGDGASSWLCPCDDGSSCYPCAPLSPLASSGFGVQSTSLEDTEQIENIQGQQYRIFGA